MLWLQIMISVKLVAKQTRNSHLAQLKKISRSDVHWIKCETRLPRGDAVQDGGLITTEGCQWECHRPAHLWLKPFNVDVKSVEWSAFYKKRWLNYKILTKSFCRTFYFLWILSRIALNFDKIVFHLNKHISLFTYINGFVIFQNVPDKFVNYSQICLLKRIQREAQILNPWFSSTI